MSGQYHLSHHEFGGRKCSILEEFERFRNWRMRELSKSRIVDCSRKDLANMCEMLYMALKPGNEDHITLRRPFAIGGR
jgi:hypothetical protein